jgi:hypothetical protein
MASKEKKPSWPVPFTQHGSPHSTPAVFSPFARNVAQPQFAKSRVPVHGTMQAGAAANNRAAVPAPKAGGILQPRLANGQGPAVRVPEVFRPFHKQQVQAKLASQPGSVGVPNRSPSQSRAPSPTPAAFGARFLVQRSAPAAASASAGAAPAPSLDQIARALHAAAGGDNQGTTAVGILRSGAYVVSTQISVANVAAAASKFNIAATSVTAPPEEGCHVEVDLFCRYGAELARVGASQGFCEYCATFLTAKTITMVGAERQSKSHLWKSPEYLARGEVPAGCTYIWARLRSVLGAEVEYATKAAWDAGPGANLNQGRSLRSSGKTQ